MFIEKPFGGARLMRRGRSSFSGQIYLLTACSSRREPFLRGLAEGRALVEEFRIVEVERKARTLAYVVMPDHFHWLIRLGYVSDLSVVIKQVKARSAQKINKIRARNGSVWQRGYHDRFIRDRASLRRIARYIVANPLRAGLVDDIGDWPHWDAVWV